MNAIVMDATMTSNRGLRKLAIVQQRASMGGWRYLARLIEGMHLVHSSLKISLFVSSKDQKRPYTAGVLSRLRGLGVDISTAPLLRFEDPNKIIGRIARAVRFPRLRRWIRVLNSFDAALFTWPFGIECPLLDCPTAFVPHDLNYSHFVGAFVDPPKSIRVRNALLEDWLRKSNPIVSTNFIATELAELFPGVPHTAKVIPISSLGTDVTHAQQEERELLRSLGVPSNYVLCLNNISSHKNLGQVLGAFYYVQERYPGLSLVLGGEGTDRIRGCMRTPWYLDTLIPYKENVVSVGLCSDDAICALIRGARLVINGSLYEAGNGSGLDAWSLGTPVAMSAIPAFLEQMEFLDVRAEVFHPRCCFEIANAMNRILDAPEVASKNAAYSKESMLRYTWSEVATQYISHLNTLVAKKVNAW